MESFIQDPSDSLLEQCTNEQLLRIAEHYEVDIANKKLKEDGGEKGLKDCLFEAEVLCLQPVSSPGTLTFEQQKELLQFQLKQQLEI